MEDDPWCQLTRVKEQYRRLKEEHQRLQLEFGNLEVEHKNVIDVLGAAQADCAKQIESLQVKNKELERELFLLRPHIITAEAEELIKIKAIEDVEVRYMEEIRQCVAQIDGISTERNELRRENDFLKGELSSLSESVERVKHEYRQRLDVETAALQRQRDALMSDEKTRVADASRRAHQLELENRQLSMKMNSVLKENEELTISYQKLQSECSNSTRDMAKKVANLNGQLSALIAERDCCRQQCDLLSREVASLSESNVRLTSRVHDLERQNGHLQAMIDEMTHNHTMDLNSAKLQYLNERSNIERERTEMRLQLKECEVERDSLRHALDQKSEALIEKERQCEQKIAMVEHRAVETKAELENKISELNAKLAECERRSRQLEDKLANIKEQSAARVDALLKEKDGLNLEIVALKEEVTRLRNKPEPTPFLIETTTQRSHTDNVVNQYSNDYFDSLKRKVHRLKEKLRAAKRDLEALQALKSGESDAIKKLEEKNKKMRLWMEEFCRAHGRFSKMLEANDEFWNKENMVDCGPFNNSYNGNDFLTMFRTVNDKLAAIEQRTARQLGMSALGTHAQSTAHSPDGQPSNVPRSEPSIEDGQY